MLALAGTALTIRPNCSPKMRLCGNILERYFNFLLKNLCSKAFLADYLIVLTVVWFQMLRTCEGKSKNCLIKLCGTLCVARLLVFSNGQQYVACRTCRASKQHRLRSSWVTMDNIWEKEKKTLNKVDKKHNDLFLVFLLCSTKNKSSGLPQLTRAGCLHWDNVTLL